MTKPSDPPIIIAGSRPWNREPIKTYGEQSGRQVLDVTTPNELEEAIQREPGLRYIFFLHWSHLVPEEVTANYECVCFHMTDVPYGRGGSPLQNLIARGHTSTMLTALRMVPELDAGPVYMKKPLAIREGSALEIYRRAGALSCEMIEEILLNKPSPVPQSGEVTTFRRRTPEQSVLPQTNDLETIHNHVRMLDAPGYPPAFIEINGLRIEFSNSRLTEDSIEASVRISITKPSTTQSRVLRT